MQPERLNLGKDVAEGRDDDAQVGPPELVERQPLAEESAGREHVPDGLDVIARVHRTLAGAVGEEQVADHDVVAQRSRADEMAAVDGQDPDPADAARGGRFLGEGFVARVEPAQHVDHLGDDLERVDSHVRTRGGRSRGSSGPEADEEGALRSRMEEQRDQALSPREVRALQAAQHVVVVEHQDAVAARLVEDGDGARDAFAVIDELVVGRAAPQADVGRKGEPDPERDRHRDAGPRQRSSSFFRGLEGCDEQREEHGDPGDPDEARAEPDRRQRREAEQERRGHRAERVPEIHLAGLSADGVDLGVHESDDHREREPEDEHRQRHDHDGGTQLAE